MNDIWNHNVCKGVDSFIMYTLFGSCVGVNTSVLTHHVELVLNVYSECAYQNQHFSLKCGLSTTIREKYIIIHTLYDGRKIFFHQSSS